MTTGIQAVYEWPRQTDTQKSRVDTVYRALAAAGFLRLSGRGGGKSAVHWEAPEIVTHAVGIAVSEPATAAADTTPLFMQLRRYDDPKKAAPVDAFGICRDTWGETLVGLCERGARDPSFITKLKHAHFEARMLLGRPVAYIHYDGPDGSVCHVPYVLGEGTSFDNQSWPPRSTKRTATIDGDQLEMLAEFLRDTWEHQGRLPSSADGSGGSSNTKPGNDDPDNKTENENGAALAGATPNTRSRNHRKTANPEVNDREASAGRGGCHALHGGGLVHAGDSDRPLSNKWSSRYEHDHAYPAAPAFG